MIDFNKELKKFKPILNVDNIEKHIDDNDMKDINDYIREINSRKEIERK